MYKTPSAIKRQETPSAIQRQETPSAIKRQETPSAIQRQETPSAIQRQQESADNAYETDEMKISSATQSIVIKVRRTTTNWGLGHGAEGV